MLVLGRPFHCPTLVHSDCGYQTAIREVIGSDRWALATSSGWTARGAVAALTAGDNPPIAVIDRIPENPKVSAIVALHEELPEMESLVALGGGSVIDCAKGLLALRALDGDGDILMAHLRDGAALPDGFAPRPLIAVPTTSGTGSEVTRWATVWGDEKVKFSLNHPALYPARALLDPRLCASMPLGVTLASGLDGLSHAMEAVWNRNHTDVSDQFALAAIRRLRGDLPAVMQRPADVSLRRDMQVSALFAGFAMSTTQTALAHSISYPFTALFGMPHGFACSFTLSEVARYNAEADSGRVALIAEAFGCSDDEFPDTLAEWLEALGIGGYLSAYVAPTVTDELGDNLITRARAANNLRDVDGATARALARRSLERFCGAPAVAAQSVS